MCTRCYMYKTITCDTCAASQVIVYLQHLENRFCSVLKQFNLISFSPLQQLERNPYT